MERPAPDSGNMGGGFGPSELPNSISSSDHLLGGPAGEGEQHDSAWVDTHAEQVSDAVGERLSLARPGSGNNEDRSPASFRRCPLLRIQIIQPRKFRWNTFVEISHKDSIAESPPEWQGSLWIVSAMNR